MTPSHSWEDHQHDLNPDRDSERDRVYASVAATLRARGVDLTGDESSDELAEILSSVEQFEAAVSALGGDRMVNDRYSSQPDDPSLVIPPRAADETPRRYAERLTRMATRLNDLTK
jgi:hypothetical protein